MKRKKFGSSLLAIVVAAGLVVSSGGTAANAASFGGCSFNISSTSSSGKLTMLETCNPYSFQVKYQYFLNDNSTRTFVEYSTTKVHIKNHSSSISRPGTFKVAVGMKANPR